jgi:hypothetical protein
MPVASESVRFRTDAAMALAVMGHTPTRSARAAGLNPAYVREVVAGRLPEVRRQVSQAVEDAYGESRDKTRRATAQRAAAGVRHRAGRERWVNPAGLNDDRQDQPDYRPAVTSRTYVGFNARQDVIEAGRRCRPAGRGVAAKPGARRAHDAAAPAGRVAVQARSGPVRGRAPGGRYGRRAGRAPGRTAAGSAAARSGMANISPTRDTRITTGGTAHDRRAGRREGYRRDR